MEKPLVTIYFRQGCHLCEDMLLHVANLQEAIPFQLESVDVDNSRELQQRYGHLVPVMEAGGKEICRYYLDEKALTDYFRSYVSKVL